MKTTERTLDEAFDEFNKLSKLPRWIRWLYVHFHKPQFPVCVKVYDSRQDQEDPNDDYLLVKHFLTTTQEESGSHTLISFVIKEAKGEQNKPYEIIEEDSDYCWPAGSLKHAQKLAFDFAHLV